MRRPVADTIRRRFAFPRRAASSNGGARALLSLAVVVGAPAVAPAQAGSRGGGATRVGDGAPLAGRVAWWRADQAVDHGFTRLVERWGDLTGNGATLTGSGNGESQPEWLPVAIGGRPGVRFDGNDWLRGVGMPLGSYTKAVVCRLDDLAATNNVVSSDSHHALWFAGSPFARIFHLGDVVQSTVPVTAGTPFVLIATYDAPSGRATLYLDRQLVARTTRAPGNVDVSVQLGAFAWGNHLAGVIGEVALFDHELDPHELAALHDDLERRWFSPAPVVEWAELPRPGQLLQRDDQQQSVAVVRGFVMSPGASSVTLEVERDGLPFWQRTDPLHYLPSGRASFRFDVTLDAGLHAHELRVFVDDGGPARRLVADVPEVTVGDVYLVNGQSNAQASDYWGERLGNQSQDRWIRSFGTASISGATEYDAHWDRAEGEGWWSHGAVGQWALRMAEVLRQREQMPIAILNGAVGGTGIWSHQRNDAWPTDPATIYGRLLWRMEEAALATAVRGLLWYQGESDASNPASWLSGWNELRADWAVDYPALERVYVVQIRNDCGAGGHSLMETQRNLIATWNDTRVMASTAVPAHDGCHFLYAGYRDLGEKLARLLRRDFFGSNDTQDIDAPNLQKAAWTDATQTKIDLTFRDPLGQMVFDAGAEVDFVLTDGTAVVSGSASGNVVTLTLAGPSTAKKISYRGHPFDGPWLRNVRGVGALCFERQPIR
jgi:hypothetical protein